MKSITATSLAFLLILNSVFAQQNQSKTFEIEKLSRPDHLLKEKPVSDVIQQQSTEILAHSKLADTLVDISSPAHSFFNGMYIAYAEHRPVVISPDMIWLLICQGFSQHVNNNSSTLRHLFVNHKDKISIKVKIPQTKPLNIPTTWEDAIPQFMAQISDNTKDDLIKNLTPTFSTTTTAEKIATKITVMESMRTYFEYVVIYEMCGIPEITIKGTPEDWTLLKEKTNTLRRYELDWWINEIDPLLDEFIAASQGKFKKRFWRNMFKYHTKKVYGAPKIIDGWIIKFFPYDKKGKRNDLKTLRSSENLPDERAVVDFKLMYEHPDTSETTSDLQFVAGFFGLTQNHKNQALEPQIGWLVQTKDTSTFDKYKESLEFDLENKLPIHIKVSEMPKEILQQKKIERLKIEFLDSIKVPAELSLVEIKLLTLIGKISTEESEKIKLLFPHTALYIVDSKNE